VQFRDEIVSKRIKFIPFVVSRNINIGIAQRTRQTREQKRRLNDFLKAEFFTKNCGHKDKSIK